MTRTLHILLFALAALVAAAAGAQADEGMYYPGDIVYTEPVVAVVFSHKAHLARKGVTCDSCHTRLFQLEINAGLKKGDFYMDSLYAGRYCGGCHNGKVAFASNTQCARCHIGKKGYKELTERGILPTKAVKGPSVDIVFGSGETAATFRHLKHAELRCSECHTSLFMMDRSKIAITMSALSAGKYCGKCHNGTRAFATFDCWKCHPTMTGASKTGPKETFTFGEGETIAKFSHEPHVVKAKLKCTACHMELFKMTRANIKIKMDDINGGKSCGTCHNGKVAFAADACNKCHPKM